MYKYPLSRLEHALQNNKHHFCILYISYNFCVSVRTLPFVIQQKTIELQRLIRTFRVNVVRAGRLELPRKLPFSGF